MQDAQHLTRQHLIAMGLLVCLGQGSLASHLQACSQVSRHHKGSRFSQSRSSLALYSPSQHPWKQNNRITRRSVTQPHSHPKAPSYPRGAVSRLPLLTTQLFRHPSGPRCVHRVHRSNTPWCTYFVQLRLSWRSTAGRTRLRKRACSDRLQSSPQLSSKWSVSSFLVPKSNTRAQSIDTQPPRPLTQNHSHARLLAFTG